MFQLCDTIKTCEEEIYSRIRELLQINYDTKPQIYEGKILPLLSILITGDKLPNKKCVDLVIPDNMDERLRRFYEATMTLDSAKGELTRFIGGIAYDV
jgi:hypothetical protein